MKESRFDRMERLFRAALMHPPEEQESFLDAACTDDKGLRDEVLSLLRSDQEADKNSFLDKPITDLSDLGNYLESQGEEKPDKLTGTEIGPYRVLRFLGHGGMGDVFLAVREEPFRHHVALKIIRRGMDTEEVTRRFEMERQILASLSHTNIARLYDGGVTAEGLPYFAMEYVDGIPATTWCDNRQMNLNDRLRMFQYVCRAVHHAHQNLIIHRDLKPSNILVTADGAPKLLDFGIAKLLNPNLGPVDAPVTRTEIRAMTPEYASPEQVRGESLTTASDIYSLGMILYELLTGHRPYRFVRRTSEEILSVICEQEPERPSIVVTQKEKVQKGEGETFEILPEDVGKNRGLSPERLGKRLRGDLDNIVLMSLRKEPERRYTSAEQLANDIEKYLAGVPVIAHKDSRGYRIQKYVRRHRVQTISVAIIFCVLVVSAVITIYQANQVAHQRDRAQLEASRAESVTDFLISLFRAADPSFAPTDTLTVRELLDNGAKRVETELADQPEIQATIYDVIGTAYSNIGRYDLAESLFERGLTQQRALGEEGERLATALYSLGYTDEMLAKYAESAQLFREFLKVRERISGKVNPSYVSGLFHLGSVLHLSGNGKEANALYDEWEGLYDQLENKERSELAEITFGMARVCFARKQYAKAERYLHEVLHISVRTYGEKHPNVASATMMLASVQVAAGKNDDAEETAWKTLTLLQELYPDGHQEIASVMGVLAEIFEQQKKFEKAEEYFKQSIELWDQLMGLDFPNASLSRAELGRFYYNRKQYAEAEKWYQQAHRGFVNLFGEENLMTISLRKSLVQVIIARGKTAEARAILQADYNTLLRERGPDYTTTKEVKELLETL